MSAKTYRFCAGFAVTTLAAFVAWSILVELPIYVPLAGVVVAMLVLRLCRQRTREVLHDERMKVINEKATAISHRVFSFGMAIAAVVFLSLRQSLPPYFYIIGETLAYAVCGLMLLHLVFYYYYSRRM